MEKKGNSYSCTIDKPIPAECLANYKNPIQSVYFNPSTKEVFNEQRELIGTGEYKDGILTVTVNPPSLAQQA